MESTGLIAFLLIGAIAGWLAGTLMKGGGFGLFGNIVVGIIGAVIGGYVFSLLGISAGGMIGAIVTATVGAAILLYFVGLIKKGKQLTNFTIAGADKVFSEAKAKIVGNTIIVSAKNVKNPIAVRFAFTDTAEPNLYNTQGLPASAFRTDSWKFK